MDSLKRALRIDGIMLEMWRIGNGKSLKTTIWTNICSSAQIVCVHFDPVIEKMRNNTQKLVEFGASKVAMMLIEIWLKHPIVKVTEAFDAYFLTAKRAYEVVHLTHKMKSHSTHPLQIDCSIATCRLT